MGVKPLVILGSARKNSETDKFVEFVLHDVEYRSIDLLDWKISGYDYAHEYPSGDQYHNLVEELLTHQLIIFATPVYWYSMSALMKNFFDRFSDLVTYKKIIGRKLKGKSTALIAVGAEGKLPNGFETPFSSTSAYLDMKYLGSIYHSVEKTVYNKSSVTNFRKKLNMED